MLHSKKLNKYIYLQIKETVALKNICSIIFLFIPGAILYEIYPQQRLPFLEANR
jgi:hypothetical protein